MRSLRAVHSVSPDRLDVDAGADWRTVVRCALSHGLTPPVLTAYLGLTVGGTLSIGGIGTTTFRYGAQVDHVLELQVVTGEGQVLTCSETSHRDLFEVEWQQHYSAVWPALVQAKRRYDPDRRLASGPDLFRGQ